MEGLDLSKAEVEYVCSIKYNKCLDQITMTIFSGWSTTASARNPVWTIVSSNRHNNDVRIWLLPPMLSVLFTVQFRSRWYLCARKSPYALHPVSEVFPTLPVCTLPVAGLQPTSQSRPWTCVCIGPWSWPTFQWTHLARPSLGKFC